MNCETRDLGKELLKIVSISPFPTVSESFQVEVSRLKHRSSHFDPWQWGAGRGLSEEPASDYYW